MNRNFFNKYKSQTINARRITKTILESALNLAQNYTSSLKKHIFENTEKDNSKNKYETKIENRFVKLCAEFNADLKTVFVFLLALIVFDFYSFEKKKKIENF